MQSRQKPSHLDRVVSYVKAVDFFGEQVPSFRLKGQERVHTWPGACFTFVILAVVLAFFILKIIFAASTLNPRVSVFFQRDFYTEQELIDTSKESFKFAFSFENVFDNESRLDES